MIVSLVTGIRIAADAQVIPLSKWLAPILPHGERRVHFVAGLMLFLTGTAYLLGTRRREPART
jgi:hypothetical protein